MREAVIVLRKELAELLGDWHSMYGALIQTGILVAICGVIVPADKPAIWLSPGQLALMYGAFPAVIAATLSADSFAGEGERRTLETLLATPLRENAIFLGKLVAAVVMAMAASAISMIAGLIASFATSHEWPSVPPTHLLLLFAGAGAFASVTAGLASQISLRVQVARAAQQVSSMLSMALTFTLAFAFRRLGLEVDWATLPQIIGLLVVLSCAIAYVGVVALRRDRIFDRGGRRTR